MNYFNYRLLLFYRSKELPHLKDQFQLLAEEINSLEYKKNNSKTVLSALQNQISAIKNSLKIYQSALDDRIQSIAEAHKKLAQLESIKNNSKNYQKIERTAEQKANDVLNNKKAILIAAVIAVLGALRNRPGKQQLLIYDSFYPSNNNSTADIFVIIANSKSGKLSSYAISS
jgi:chromosome segregation ATPase